MENASKALIIAGAILLAILIIGLGVFIYNQAANTVNDNGMDQIAVRQFNGQFESYLGRTLSSTAAKSLLDTIELNNRTNGSDKFVSPGRSIDRSSIKLGHKYETSVSYDYGGRISEITITDVSSAVLAGNKDEAREDLAALEKDYEEVGADERWDDDCERMEK